jgi:undecaprenyl-diphosphatase
MQNQRVGSRAIFGVLPALWLATSTVEFPIKSFFRRRRPFLSLIRAIVVGRKPGSYSFPSGHSAAAFAGASLLCCHYPRWKILFYTIAGLVGFSRVYLGAHFPGDVLVGGVVGTSLAHVYRGVLRGIFRKIFG